MCGFSFILSSCISEHAHKWINNLKVSFKYSVLRNQKVQLSNSKRSLVKIPEYYYCIRPVASVSMHLERIQYFVDMLFCVLGIHKRVM
jgi:hypothetical protein